MELKKLRQSKEVKKCLAGKAESTKNNYLSGLKIYANYRDMTPEELIDEIEEDRQKPRRERGEVEYILKEFFAWMQNEKPKLKRGGRASTGEKGISPKKASVYLAAVRSFYKANGFPVFLKTPKVHTLPKNEKMSLRARHVKKLVDHAPTLRDKAIILMLFQSGMDISTLCSLKYRDVAKGLKAYKENGKHPMLISVVRKKAHINFTTFLAKDGIDALLAYMNKRRESGDEIKLNDPLFVKERVINGDDTISKDLIQKMMRKVALRSGVVSQEEMQDADMNPCRPHALRAAFKTILMLQGAPKELTEYWMGHESDYGGAYNLPTKEEQLKIYEEHCDHLSINRATEQVKKLEKKYNGKMQTYDEIIERQASKIKHLESQITDMEQSKEQQAGADLLKVLDGPGGEELARRIVELAQKQQGQEQE